MLDDMDDEAAHDLRDDIAGDVTDVPVATPRIPRYEPSRLCARLRTWL
jgi:hypothetical protein